MVGTLPPSLPPAPLSSRQTFTTSKRQMQTQSKPAIVIAPILPSVTEKKVARGRRDAAPPKDGKEKDTASKNNLEGGASAPGMIMHAVMNGLGRPADRGGGRRDHRKAGVSAVCEMTALTRSSPVAARPAVAASPPWPHRKWIRGKREEERIDSIFIKKMLSRQLEIGREFELEWGGGEGERKARVARA